MATEAKWLRWRQWIARVLGPAFFAAYAAAMYWMLSWW